MIREGEERAEVSKTPAPATVTWVTLALTVLVAALKSTGFIVSGAASAQAASSQALGDVATQAVLFFGLLRARREPPRYHPWGFGRERYFWAIVTATLVFGLGGVYAVVTGLSGWNDEDTPDRLFVAALVLTAGLVLDFYLMRRTYHFARGVHPQYTIWELRRKDPEALVVLWEDATSVVGSAVALLGLLMVLLTADSRGDAVGAIVVGLILIASATLLISGIKRLLIGEALSPAEYQRTLNAALRTENVARVAAVKGQRVDPQTLSIEMCVVLERSGMTGEQISSLCTTIEERVQSRFYHDVVRVTVRLSTPPIETGDIVEVRPKRG